MHFIKNFLKEPEKLDGVPKAVVQTVDQFKHWVQQIPPISVGIGVGAGCGVGLGWELGDVGKYGIGPPKAFVGCGAGVGVGFGLGQGFGKHLTKDNRSPAFKDSIKQTEQNIEQWITSIPALIEKTLFKREN